MIDLKNYPNEVILYFVIKHAERFNIFYYTKHADSEVDDRYFNGTFYSMLEKLTIPNLHQAYDEMKQKENALFEEEKRNLTTRFVEGKIDTETILSNFEKLRTAYNKKISQLDNDLKTYSTIKTRLMNDLSSFDMKDFEKGKPIGPAYFDQHSLILTKNYMMGVCTSHSNPNYRRFYYLPEYKEKFDKILGKTKSAEKAEPEKTK